MFNIKRIALVLSIMGLVAMTGALMAGPAFASKKESEHRAYVCHYQAFSAEFTDLVTGEVTPQEDEMWQAKQIDSSSVDKHIANHGFGEAEEAGDTVISDMGENSPLFAGYVTTTKDECLARALAPVV